MKEVLGADSIAKSFGERRVLTSARFAAAAGAITLLAGRNGSGKSTLLRICAGVLAPDQGVIRFGGMIGTRARLYKLATLGVFYLPDRDVLSPAKSIRYHMEAVQERFGVRGSIDAIANSLDIAQCLGRTSHEISGGERRRAEIALVLTRDPLCVLADEPLRGIDPKDRHVIIAALKDLAKRGCTVVVSGHETSDLLAAADSVFWVTAGTTYELGSGSEALQHEQFRREYLTGAWR